ncbi:hypothetical protein [Priestia aryabhattai]|uniref:hypothetical protein n=1 Tax=Priestia aryabhattai TaxID=412384 RepID=UPI0015F45028|nr:hypothetical protein [Priestia aryabhattai]
MKQAKFNQSRKKSAQEIASILNDCNMLIDLSIEDQANKIVLNVQTDSVSAQYTELDTKRMDSFLGALIEYVDNKDDIEELKEELMDLQFN